jgi:hypothetical protein
MDPSSVFHSHVVAAITLCGRHHGQQLTYAVNRITKRAFAIDHIFAAVHREPHRARGVAFLQHFAATIRALDRAFGQAIGLLGPDDAARVRLHRDEALKVVISAMTAIADNSAPRVQDVAAAGSPRKMPRREAPILLVELQGARTCTNESAAP